MPAHDRTRSSLLGRVQAQHEPASESRALEAIHGHDENVNALQQIGGIR